MNTHKSNNTKPTNNVNNAQNQSKNDEYPALGAHASTTDTPKKSHVKQRTKFHALDLGTTPAVEHSGSTPAVEHSGSTPAVEHSRSIPSTPARNRGGSSSSPLPPTPNPNIGGLPADKMPVISADFDAARQELIRESKWVTCELLEAKVTGGNYRAYLQKRGLPGRPNFRDVDIYRSVNDHNRWIQSAIHATAALPFLTAKDCQNILDSAASRQGSRSDGREIKSVSDLGLGELIWHPVYLDKYFFGNEVKSIPNVTAQFLYATLLELRRGLPAHTPVKPMDLSNRLLDNCKRSGIEIQYAGGVPLTGVIVQSLGLMVKFSITAEKTLEQVIDKCREITFNRGRESLFKLISPTDLTGSYIEGARSQADSILKGVLTTNAPVCYDFVTIFELLSHELGLDAVVRSKFNKKGKGRERHENKSVDKDLLKGLAIIASLALSADDKMKKNIEFAQKHVVEHVSLPNLCEVIRTQLQSKNEITLGVLANIEHDIALKFRKRRFEDLGFGTLLHVLNSREDLKRLLTAQLSTDVVAANVQQEIEDNIEDNEYVAEYITSAISNIAADGVIRTIEQLVKLEARVNEMLQIEFFEQQGSGSFLHFVCSRMLTDFAGMIELGHTKTSHVSGIDAKLVSSFWSSCPQDVDMRKCLSRQFGVDCSNVDEPVQIKKSKIVYSEAIIHEKLESKDLASKITTKELVTAAPCLVNLASYIGWTVDLGCIGLFLEDLDLEGYCIMCDRGGVYIKIKSPDFMFSHEYEQAVSELSAYNSVLCLASKIASQTVLDESTLFLACDLTTKNVMRSTGNAQSHASSVDKYFLSCLRLCPVSFRSTLWKTVWSRSFVDVAGSRDKMIERLSRACVDESDVWLLRLVGVHATVTHDQPPESTNVHDTPVAVVYSPTNTPVAPVVLAVENVVVEQPVAAENLINDDNHPVTNEVEAKRIVETIAADLSAVANHRLAKTIHGAMGASTDAMYSDKFRCLFELLQNADDNEYDASEEPSIAFVIESDRVVVYNNERGFSERNMTSLCCMGDSSKLTSNGLIGMKGIGFKSVFGLSDNPQVHSGGFHIQFKKGGLNYVTPVWINEPVPGLPIGLPVGAWTTRIVLPLNNEGRQLVDKVESLKDLNGTVLLFLNKLKAIHVYDRCNDRQISYRKQVDGDVVQLINGENVEEWLIVSRQFAPTVSRPLPTTDKTVKEVKQTTISAAVPLTFIKSRALNQSVYESTELCNDPVFAYLPVTRYNLPYILQADFVLPSNREAIDRSSTWNTMICEQLSGPDGLIVAVVESVKKHLLADGMDPLAVSYACLDVIPVESESQALFKSHIHSAYNYLSKIPLLLSEEGMWVSPRECVSYGNDMSLYKLLPEILLQHLYMKTRVLDRRYNSRRSGHVGEVLGKKLFDVVDIDNDCTLLVQALEICVDKFPPKSKTTITFKSSSDANEDDVDINSDDVYASAVADSIADPLNDKPAEITLNCLWYYNVLMAATARVGNQSQLKSRLRNLPILYTTSKKYVPCTSDVYLMTDSTAALNEALKVMSNKLVILDHTALDSMTDRARMIKVLHLLGVVNISMKVVVNDIIMKEYEAAVPCKEVIVPYTKLLLSYYNELRTDSTEFSDFKRLMEKAYVYTSDGSKRVGSCGIHFERGNLSDVFRPLGIPYVTLDPCHVVDKNSRTFYEKMMKISDGLYYYKEEKQYSKMTELAASHKNLAEELPDRNAVIHVKETVVPTLLSYLVKIKSDNTVKVSTKLQEVLTTKWADLKLMHYEYAVDEQIEGKYANSSGYKIINTRQNDSRKWHESKCWTKIGQLLSSVAWLCDMKQRPCTVTGAYHASEKNLDIIRTWMQPVELSNQQMCKDLGILYDISHQFIEALLEKQAEDASKFSVPHLTAIYRYISPSIDLSSKSKRIVCVPVKVDNDDVYGRLARADDMSGIYISDIHNIMMSCFKIKPVGPIPCLGSVFKGIDYFFSALGIPTYPNEDQMMSAITDCWISDTTACKKLLIKLVEGIVESDNPNTKCLTLQLPTTNNRLVHFNKPLLFTVVNQFDEYLARLFDGLDLVDSAFATAAVQLGVRQVSVAATRREIDNVVVDEPASTQLVAFEELRVKCCETLNSYLKKIQLYLNENHGVFYDDFRGKIEDVFCKCTVLLGKTYTRRDPLRSVYVVNNSDSREVVEGCMIIKQTDNTFILWLDRTKSFDKIAQDMLREVLYVILTETKHNLDIISIMRGLDNYEASVALPMVDNDGQKATVWSIEYAQAKTEAESAGVASLIVHNVAVNNDAQVPELAITERPELEIKMSATHSSHARMVDDGVVLEVQTESEVYNNQSHAGHPNNVVKQEQEPVPPMTKVESYHGVSTEAKVAPTEPKIIREGDAKDRRDVEPKIVNDVTSLSPLCESQHGALIDITEWQYAPNQFCLETLHKMQQATAVSVDWNKYLSNGNTMIKDLEGTAGERWVYDSLVARYRSDASITVVLLGNQGPYDIVIKKNGKDIKYIEVKSTSNTDGSIVFHMSYNELEAARLYPSMYDVYCVFGVGKRDTRVLCIQQLYEHLRNKTVQVIMHVPQ